MALESQLTEEQLFDQLIASIVHSAWIAMGKIKNPVTDKIERDLFQASMNIDMLDMLFKRMDGNLSDREEQYIDHILRELKLNYIEEKKKGDQEEKPETKADDLKSEPTAEHDDKKEGETEEKTSD